jgi:hypothetical protein
MVKQTNNRKHTDLYYIEVEHKMLPIILHECETWQVALREEYRSHLLSYYVTCFLVSEQHEV